MLRGADALVEADCRLHAGLQHGMVVNVVPGQRLLDVVQSIVVERQHDVHVCKGIGAVGIDGQVCVRQCMTHRGHELHVMAWHDLQLDALVAEIEVFPRPLDGVVDRADAKRHADVDCVFLAAEQRLERPVQ